MNSVQVHLALTHVPVILSIAGLLMLIVSFFLKNSTITKTSYILILIAGIAAIPVFYTGEGTEEAIENLPGVSGALIEKHEDLAKLSMISITTAGLLSLLALFTFKWQKAAGIFKVVILIIAIITGGLMAQTAQLGGQVRHTEIRSSVALLNSNDSGSAMDGDVGEKQQKDDD